MAEDGKCVGLLEVLEKELEEIVAQRTAAGTPAASLAKEASGNEKSDPALELFAHYKRLGAKGGVNLSALCLSGGGIRSATFNLGVVQRLARLRVLGEFDYLSTVSGGGYIGSWLRTWMFRIGTEKAISALQLPPSELRKDDPEKPTPDQPTHGQPDADGSLMKPEPTAVQNLRAYSNYLTPKVGLLSGDTWTAAAIILRNLLLNWLVIIPFVASVIGVPQLLLLIARGMIFEPHIGRGHGFTLLYIALIIELIASCLVYWHRRFLQMPDRDTPPSQARYIIWCVLPVCLAAGVLSTAALLLDMDSNLQKSPLLNLFGYVQLFPVPLGGLWGFAILWCMVVPVTGWMLVEVIASLRQHAAERSEEQSKPGIAQPNHEMTKQRSRTYEFLALLASGALGAALLVAVTNGWYRDATETAIFYVVLGLPVLLGIYLIARALFVSFASLSEGLFKRASVSASDDNDREWWARLSGWLLLVLAGWTVVTAICLFGRHVPESISQLAGAWGAAEGEDQTLPEKVVHLIITVLGAISGTAAALLSSSDSTVNDAQKPGATSTARKIIQWTAAPLFMICLLILLTWGTAAFGEWLISFWEDSCIALFSICADFCRPLRHVTRLDLWVFGLMLVGLAAISWMAGAFVNVNRFSLHGMYRNRLVRAYLGASNPDRRPDPFTGFSWRDNPKLWELWRRPSDPPPKGSKKVPPATRPLPIINTTLNLVQGKNLAWQQRKAASFSMTPFHCGNFRLGYRPSHVYGGPSGISVGTAVTISGAAANPNMGYNSSPVLAFLMTLFNVRLGAWLGNTNKFGDATYTCAGPRQALVPILSELLGMTDDGHPYVNLSDGGHFDNLGLYEVVLRRCRYILVSDAGRDPGEKATFAFEDLGNAIRKIRIDFGVRIEFERRIRIQPKGSAAPGLYCALARVRYSEVDETPPETDGWIVYLKPTLPEDDEQLPYDVYSYSLSSKDFPHESTTDQWFSESQFESYRALGFHALDRIVSGQPALPKSLRDFIQLVSNYMSAVPTAPPA